MFCRALAGAASRLLIGSPDIHGTTCMHVSAKEQAGRDLSSAAADMELLHLGLSSGSSLVSLIHAIAQSRASGLQPALLLLQPAQAVVANVPAR